MDYLNMKLLPEYVNELPVLSVAHVGDAVYELMVRSMLSANIKEGVKAQHKRTVALVSASAQSSLSERIAPILTEEEMIVFRRGRNAKVNSVPRAASVSEYHEATALETLFGYLYLCGRNERLNKLFEIMMEKDNNGA